MGKKVSEVNTTARESWERFAEREPRVGTNALVLEVARRALAAGYLDGTLSAQEPEPRKDDAETRRSIVALRLNRRFRLNNQHLAREIVDFVLKYHPDVDLGPEERRLWAETCARVGVAMADEAVAVYRKRFGGEE
jgi:hypothetical protein